MVVDPAWYVDSGATNHVTNQLGRMQAATEYLGNQKLTVGSGQGLPIQHIGHSFLCTSNKTILLKNILHVPSITKNLFKCLKNFL